MPIYEYKAFAPGGSVQTGVIDADTPREARSKLRRDNLLVSDLWEKRAGMRAAPGKKEKGLGATLARLRQARQRSATPS